MLLLFTISGWWLERSNEFSEAQQVGDAEAKLAAQEFESEFRDYLRALQNVAAFAGSSDHTPQSFDRYLESSGFFEENPGYNDLGFAQLVRGDEALAELVTREQSFDPSFTVTNLGIDDPDGEHMVLTRTSTESITGDFGGLDLYSTPALNGDIKAVIRDERLGASSFDLTPTPESDLDLLGQLESHNLSDLEIVFIHPVLQNGEPVGMIMAKGLTGPTLEKVTGNSSQTLGLELSRDGEVVASTQLLIPSGTRAYTSELQTGSLSWTVRAFVSVPPNHLGSNAVLIIGLMLTLGAVLTMKLGTANAVTAGELRQSRHEARHDVLTGLPNRVAASEALEVELATGRTNGVKIAVLFCDLDRLRVVNDSIGHSAGDESLRVVADLIGKAKRDDDFLCRFGGDEFVLICRVESADEAVAVGERLIEVLSEPIQLASGATPVLTASIGVALAGAESATPENLLRDAELAMYRAKDAGRATVSLFAAQLRTNAVKRLETEQDLRRALKSGEIVAFFQPLIDAKTHRIDGFEALVRWDHPVRGIVGPYEFLAVAEESGLIVEVGRTVLDQAIGQVAEWNRTTGNEYRIAVNLSNRELSSSDVVHTMAKALAIHRFPPRLLELEISEDLLLTGAAKQLEILRDLRALGVTLSIDDFGTGRASLGQLRSLDMVSTLKIDQSFVLNMHTNEKDSSIIGAIVELARAVGMSTVAEGVELPEHAEVLTRLGVDLLQGYAFARPARADMIAPLLKLGPLVPYAVT